MWNNGDGAGDTHRGAYAAVHPAARPEVKPMARKRNDENPEPVPGNGDELEQPSGDATQEAEAVAGAAAESQRELTSAASDASDAGAEEPGAEAERIEAALPNETDLASQGFTPDEVRRLVVVSDRQTQSDESQIAEATLRRLRFTRWLIEHGMLDEWSA